MSRESAQFSEVGLIRDEERTREKEPRVTTDNCLSLLSC